MIWVTRQFALDGWFGVQEAFDALWAAAGNPEDMMMIGRNEETMKRRIFISLPNDELISGFPGFESINTHDLPEAPGLISGNATAFMRQFKFGID